MLKKLIFISFLISNIAIAQDLSASFDSGSMHLEKSSVVDRGLESATWSGNLILSGKFSLDIDRTPDDKDMDPDLMESSLSFLPDHAFLKKLPQIFGEIYPDRPTLIGLYSGKLNGLNLRNFLGKKDALAIIYQKYGHYEWSGSIVLNSLKTDINCDGRDFRSPKYKMIFKEKKIKHADLSMYLGC